MTNRFGATPPVGRAPEIAARSSSCIASTATCGPRCVRTPPSCTIRTARVLEFEVDAGPQARIGTVAIEGAPAEGRDAFLREVHALPSAPYEPPEITAGSPTTCRSCASEDATWRPPPTGPGPPTTATAVDLTIDVETGPVVTIAFRGDPLPQDKLAELVPIAREGSVDQDLIEDSIQRIKSYLNQQGYWKADATAERQEGEGS